MDRIVTDSSLDLSLIFPIPDPPRRLKALFHCRNSGPFPGGADVNRNGPPQPFCFNSDVGMTRLDCDLCSLIATSIQRTTK